MGKVERVGLIKALQSELGSTVISYVTSTRPNLEIPMAMDAVRKLYEHIRIAKKPKKGWTIDLFLSTNGGDGTVPWPIVNLIREHAETFRVIVPHRAFSSGTLTCLGADKILMHPMGMLGPTDPTVANQFNPRDEVTKQPLGISVEDVSSYIALIKEDVGIRHEDELIQAFSKLAEKIHPLALGNVKRFQSQSRMLAKKLLQLHMDKAEQEHNIDEIVDNLTSKLYFHGHPINRTEAKSLKLKVECPGAKLEEMIWSLYTAYEDAMSLDQKFNPMEQFIAKNPNPPLAPQITSWAMPKVNGVYIESESITDVFTLDFEVLGCKVPNGAIQTNLATKRDGWERE